MITFKSKTDPVMWWPLALIYGFGLFMSLLHGVWILIVLMSLFFLFIGHFFFTTDYAIDDRPDKRTLKIRCGIIYRKTIDIGSVKKITETRSMLNGPALSLDRLEIVYDRREKVLVSPKDKYGFIAGLKKLNRNITVLLKKDNPA